MGSFSPEWFREIHGLLLDHFGDPLWWPGETPFEVCVGAILTQNTAWSNVEKALLNLKEIGLLEPSEMASSDIETISEAVRPAGYYNQKGRYLSTFSGYLVDELNGDILQIGLRPVSDQRSELLGLKGIGRETADSIICYAVRAPIFVVDAYTKRILSRMDPDAYSVLIDGKLDEYDMIQRIVMDAIPEDLAFYNEFHALLVLLGKDLCRKSPICSSCPLKAFCITGSLFNAGVVRKK